MKVLSVCRSTFRNEGSGIKWVLRVAKRAIVRKEVVVQGVAFAAVKTVYPFKNEAKKP